MFLPLPACQKYDISFSQLIQPWSDSLVLLQQCASYKVLYCCGTNRCTIWLHCHFSPATSLRQTAPFYNIRCKKEQKLMCQLMSILHLVSVKLHWHVLHCITLVRQRQLVIICSNNIIFKDINYWRHMLANGLANNLLTCLLKNKKNEKRELLYLHLFQRYCQLNIKAGYTI